MTEYSYETVYQQRMDFNRGFLLGMAILLIPLWLLALGLLWKPPMWRERERRGQLLFGGAAGLIFVLAVCGLGWLLIAMS
jgi:hypothetical protein